MKVLCGKPAHSIYAPGGLGQNLVGLCPQHAAVLVQEARQKHRSLSLWRAASGVTCGTVVGDVEEIDTAERDDRTRAVYVPVPGQDVSVLVTGVGAGSAVGVPPPDPDSEFQPGGGLFGGGGASGSFDAPSEASSPPAEPVCSSNDTSYDSPTIAPDP